MLYVGDALQVLRGLGAATVDCCVTSPPYWGLRDYGAEGQLGLEPTPDEYVDAMVAVFREVRRVLRPEGTCWLNLGDSYSSNPKGPGGDDSSTLTTSGTRVQRERHLTAGRATGVKIKDLVGIPWRVAFALQADGWYLRCDIIWAKPNPMPESVTDRPTRAHEYVFLLTRSPRYFYDAAAIAEPAEWARWGAQTVKKKMPGAGSWLRDKTKSELDAIARPRHRKQDQLGEIRESLRGGDTASGFNDRWGNGDNPKERNKRSVWEIATRAYPDAHFAVFPEDLVEPCILAGCPEGGTVIDPFMGSGTTALVARRLGRRSIGIELNPEYAKLAAKRLSQLSLLAEEIA